MTEVQRQAYIKGRQAFLTRKPPDVPPKIAPYAQGNWYDGFFEAQVEKRIGAILARWGEPWELSVELKTEEIASLSLGT